MSDLPYDYDYALKIAKQVFANEGTLMGNPEDLAHHIMSAGRIVDGWDNNVIRKRLTLTDLFHWLLTNQGDKFWRDMRATQRVPTVS